MRKIIDRFPFEANDEGKSWIERGYWPAQWIGCRNCLKTPFVAVFRLKFTSGEDGFSRIHVSADERYELYLDGQFIGRGSERGDRENWYYETYELTLAKGEHTLAARVWALGDKAPYAQMSVRPGFILAAEGALEGVISTGIARWEARPLGGYSFHVDQAVFGTGANLTLDGNQYSFGWETGAGDGWELVETLHEGNNGPLRNEVKPIHLMRPATLPPMLEQEIRAGKVRFADTPESDDTRRIRVTDGNTNRELAEQWQALLEGGSVTVASGQKQRIVVDLDNYYCAYPEIITSGGRGSRIRVLWAEALFQQPEAHTKGNRDEIEGKFFFGVGDWFLPDGGDLRKFDTLWWQAGRYLEILVETAEEPLTINGLTLRETHYPFEMESHFGSSDPRMQEVIPIAVRAIQMCSHETYMDCPYYEQLQYVGDTRLEALVTYIMTRDDRLARKSIHLFNQSRTNDGLTFSRYPSRVKQVIPPFSLYWIAMVYDYLMWRGDTGFVQQQIKGVRAVTDAFMEFRNSQGLIEAPKGWNFVDWVPAWTWGIPPEGEFGTSGILNWHMVYTLGLVARLEEYAGDHELVGRARRVAREIADASVETFWDERRGLFADDPGKKHFSEHAQAFALLSGLVPSEISGRVLQELVMAREISRATIYFTHYLFEVFGQAGRMHELFDRLNLWFTLDEGGFRTTFESPEPSRSDCHAWGAHPIYHYFATFLGIRPVEPGLKKVVIRPQTGPLETMKGSLVHPDGGVISVDVIRKGQETLTGQVELPPGVSGTLVVNGRSREIGAGSSSF